MKAVRKCCCRYYIRELDLTGHSTLMAHNLSNAVALDYDWKSQCIFWSDVTTLGSSIKKLCTEDENATAQVIHSTTLQNPDGLAVDWIGRNLYWCDKVSFTSNKAKSIPAVTCPFPFVRVWTLWKSRRSTAAIGKCSSRPIWMNPAPLLLILFAETCTGRIGAFELTSERPEWMDLTRR